MKNSKLYMAAILSTQLLAATPGVARADEGPDSYTSGATGPQDIIIDMGKNALTSLGGEKIKEFLFPGQKVDYERIKKDMEEVTKKQIMDATMDTTMGRINSASDNARTIILRTDYVIDLDNVRMSLVSDVDSLTQGEFRKPALGNVVQGQQIEFSILAGMLEGSPKALAANLNGTCDRACVIATMKQRLGLNIKYSTDTANEIMMDTIKGSIAAVSNCWPDDEIISDWQGRPHIIHHGYKFDDKAHGYESQDYSYQVCQNQREVYISTMKNNTRIAQSDKMKWIYLARASWSKALVLLEPNMSLADKNKIIVQAVTDVSPVITPKASSCYSLVSLAVKGSPNACQTLKDASASYLEKGTCTKDILDLYDMVGCK